MLSDEVEQFIKDTEVRYGLEIVRFRGSFKEGCQEMVQRYNTRAFLLGTRKSDPHGKYVEFFSPRYAGRNPRVCVCANVGKGMGGWVGGGCWCRWVLRGNTRANPLPLPILYDSAASWR